MSEGKWEIDPEEDEEDHEKRDQKGILELMKSEDRGDINE